MTEMPITCDGSAFISIHMPHTWHDTVIAAAVVVRAKFQSTCHIRGMTIPHLLSAVLLRISIHMPHTWHDRMEPSPAPDAIHFNPHATYVA